MKELKTYLLEANDTSKKFAKDPINEMIEDLRGWWKTNCDPKNFKSSAEFKKELKEISEQKETPKVKEFFAFLEEKYSKKQVEDRKTDLMIEISQFAIDLLAAV